MKSYLKIDEIVRSLEPLNEIIFQIEDLEGYAHKITRLGNFEVQRDPISSELISYVLYYDNQPELFISMVWTNEKYKGQGYAKQIVKQLMANTPKDILLEVNRSNVAVQLYQDLGFQVMNEKGDMLFMRYDNKKLR